MVRPAPTGAKEEEWVGRLPTCKGEADEDDDIATEDDEV